MKTPTLATLVLSSILPLADAREEFVARIPNGGNVPGVAAVGHSDGTGDSSKLNVFGHAFDSAGKKWSTALCQADSDNDGQTNGEELGDPCCEWSKGGTPLWTDGVSHPADASKTSNASRWESLNCSTIVTSGSPPRSTRGPVLSVTAAAITLAVCSALAALL